MKHIDDMTIDMLIRRPGRSMSLRVTEDGLLEVRAPRLMPVFMIRRFVESKQQWIIRTRKALSDKPKVRHIQYREGEPFMLAGKKYAFHITKGNAIVAAGTRIFFPERYIEKARYHMELWLRVQAKKILTGRLDTYADVMGVSYKKITIRDTSTRWGSCSSTGTISFSYRLILADISIIDYVVIHELSHITHHNHKQIFWDRVARFYPEYKIARRWLSENGHTLRI
jgi:predicted metal-dependent hydrolase